MFLPFEMIWQGEYENVQFALCNDYVMIMCKYIYLYHYIKKYSQQNTKIYWVTWYKTQYCTLLTFKSSLKVVDLPCEIPAATIDPEWIIGPSWNYNKASFQY